MHYPPPLYIAGCLGVYEVWSYDSMPLLRCRPTWWLLSSTSFFGFFFHTHPDVSVHHFSAYPDCCYSPLWSRHVVDDRYTDCTVLRCARSDQYWKHMYAPWALAERFGDVALEDGLWICGFLTYMLPSMVCKDWYRKWPSPYLVRKSIQHRSRKGNASSTQNIGFWSVTYKTSVPKRECESIRHRHLMPTAARMSAPKKQVLVTFFGMHCDLILK